MVEQYARFVRTEQFLQDNAKTEVQKPFPQEGELAMKTARLNELNALLNLEKKENEIVDGERGEEEPQKATIDRER